MFSIKLSLKLNINDYTMHIQVLWFFLATTWNKKYLNENYLKYSSVKHSDLKPIIIIIINYYSYLFKLKSQLL